MVPDDVTVLSLPSTLVTQLQEERSIESKPLRSARSISKGFSLRPSPRLPNGAVPQYIHAPPINSNKTRTPQGSPGGSGWERFPTLPSQTCSPPHQNLKPSPRGSPVALTIETPRGCHTRHVKLYLHALVQRVERDRQVKKRGQDLLREEISGCTFRPPQPPATYPTPLSPIPRELDSMNRAVDRLRRAWQSREEISRFSGTRGVGTLRDLGPPKVSEKKKSVTVRSNLMNEIIVEVERKGGTSLKIPLKRDDDLRSVVRKLSIPNEEKLLLLGQLKELVNSDTFWQGDVCSVPSTARGNSEGLVPAKNPPPLPPPFDPKLLPQSTKSIRTI